MNNLRSRILVFLAVTFVATALAAQVENIDPNGGGGGGGSSCSVCSTDAWTYRGSGTIFMSCASPNPGNMGVKNCWIESYPEGSYCFTAGDACCVD